MNAAEMNIFITNHTPYLRAHICVVHVHACAQVFVGAFAKKVLDKLVGVFQVVPTSSPLPRLTVLQVWGLVTCASLHSSCAASFGHRMGKARRGDGIQEGCLLKSCRRIGECDKWYLLLEFKKFSFIRILKPLKWHSHLYLPLFNMLARWRPSKVQFHLSKRNWYWHSKALMVMASLRVSATPGSRLHILRCFFSSLSRSHSL